LWQTKKSVQNICRTIQSNASMLVGMSMESSAEHRSEGPMGEPRCMIVRRSVRVAACRLFRSEPGLNNGQNSPYSRKNIKEYDTSAPSHQAPLIRANLLTNPLGGPDTKVPRYKARQVQAFPCPDGLAEFSFTIAMTSGAEKEDDFHDRM
jgi:hypothetical protein